MTPYTKKIVELHKIHKAIEDCECKKDDEQGGGSGSILMIEMEEGEMPYPANVHPKTIPSEFNSELEYWNYTFDFILNGGIVVFKFLNGHILVGPENMTLVQTVVNINDNAGDSANDSLCRINTYDAYWMKPVS